MSQLNRIQLTLKALESEKKITQAQISELQNQLIFFGASGSVSIRGQEITFHYSRAIPLDEMEKICRWFIALVDNG